MGTRDSAYFSKHLDFRVVVTYRGQKVADSVVPTEQEGWLSFEIQHSISLDIQDPIFPLELEIDFLNKNGGVLFSGYGRIDEDHLIFRGLGSYGPVNNDGLGKV
jgi:hypothetical protein